LPVSLLTELDAFYTEHRLCGELDADVDGPVVWIYCDCGARIVRRVTEGLRMPAAVALDARGRRLRAALAAVLVKAQAPKLQLMHELFDSWAGIGLIVVGLARQGWDLQLTAYAGTRWRATF
jgi:hypothetical protein